MARRADDCQGRRELHIAHVRATKFWLNHRARAIMGRHKRGPLNTQDLGVLFRI